MRHEDLKFRKYSINSQFGYVEFIVNSSQFPNIENPSEEYINTIVGFSFSYSNLTDVNGVTILKDGKDFIFGIPLNMSKEDVIKMIEFETYAKLTNALKGDNFVNVKNKIEVNISNREQFLSDMFEHIKKINTTAR